MGVSEEVEVDVRGPIDLQEGDVFIICSDGLHGVVKEEEMKQVARLSVEGAADEFLRRALEKGAPDNVTVIVARVEREGGFDPDSTVVEAGDRELFDDTIREEAKEPVEERSHAPVDGQDVAGEVARAPQSLASEVGSAPQDSAGDAVRAPRAPHGFSILKWTLIFVLVLGAAGAGIFWAQQQRFARQAQSSSR